ncbi:MAG: hypothetical protein ACK5XX_03150 [Holosporales bacterium]|jgi:hypothetical protein
MLGAEYRRYTAEHGIAQVLLTAALVLCAFAAAYFAVLPGMTASANAAPRSALLAETLNLGFLFVALGGFLWGGKAVSDGVMEDFNGNIWVWQQASVVSPLQFMLGKLFGAPVLSWLLVLLTGLCVSSVTLLHVGAEAAAQLILIAFLLLSIGFLFNLGSCFLLPYALKRLNKTQLGLLHSMVALLLAFILQSFGGLIVDVGLGIRQAAPVLWYGYVVPGVLYYITLSGVVAAIAGLSVYAVIRSCLLGQREVYFALIALLILGFLAGGSAAELWNQLAKTLTGSEGQAGSSFYAVMLSLYIVAALATYAALFFSTKSVVVIETFLAALTQSFAATMAAIPAWVMTGSIALLAAFFAVTNRFDAHSFTVIGLAAYLVRDAAIVLYFNFASRKGSRPDMAALGYILLLYFLVPPLLQAANQPLLASLFWVDIANPSLTAMLSACIQAATVSALAIRRYKTIAARHKAGLASPASLKFSIPILPLLVLPPRARTESPAPPADATTTVENEHKEEENFTEGYSLETVLKHMEKLDDNTLIRGEDYEERVK